MPSEQLELFDAVGAVKAPIGDVHKQDKEWDTISDYGFRERHLRQFYEKQSLGRIKSKFYPDALVHRKMYRHSNKPQYVLPFDEFRRVSNNEMKELLQFKFPAWDRDNNGELYTVTQINVSRYKVLEWADKNTSGRFGFAHKTGKVYFEKFRDYLACTFMFRVA